MKHDPKKILAFFLAGALLLSATACATGGGDEDTGLSNDTTADTEADTGYKPDIEKTDYDCEFVITGVDSIRGWALANEDSSGDPLEDSIYERSIHSRAYRQILEEVLAVIIQVGVINLYISLDLFV